MSERIVYGDREAALRIAVAIGRVPNLATDAPISVHRNGVLLGGAVYCDYTRESVCAHVAGFAPGWMSRLFLYMVFDYPFNQMKVKRIFAHVPANNLVALDFNIKLGFKPLTSIPGVYPNDTAMMILRMEREDCRWLKLAGYYRREHADGQG